MFRPTPMMKLQALVLERDARRVLESWGRRGAVQLTRTAPGPDAAPLAPRDRRLELAHCANLRARVDALQRMLEISPGNRSKSHLPRASGGESAQTFPGGSPENGADPRRRLLPQRAARREPGAAPPGVVAPALTLESADEALRELERRASSLALCQQQLDDRRDGLTATGDRLSDFCGLDVPLDGSDQFAFLHFVTGSLPVENWVAFQEQMGGQAALVPLPEKAGRQTLIVMTTRGRWPALKDLLGQAGFQVEPLPVAEGKTTDSLAAESRRELEQTRAELDRVNGELQSLIDEAGPLLDQIEQFAARECRLLEAEQQLSRTEAAVLLTGWIPRDSARHLAEETLGMTGGRCVMEVRDPESLSDQTIPILLRHPPWLRPFALLVSAYGLPTYRELEPTVFVALSYVLMFGMMFGDVGHGAVLALGGLAACFAPGAKRMRDLGVLLLFGGGSSMVFGFVYGSCFGLECFKPFALWHDPLEGDPMTLMRFAIGVGVAVISLGLVLNILNRLRRGDVLGACLDKFGLAGVLFYWGALALILKSEAIASRGLMLPAVSIFLALPLLGWVLKEPLEYGLRRHQGAASGWFGAVSESLVAAFEAVLSYFANTISFVRLAAYAMSHAALLAAAFTLAAEMRHLAIGAGPLSVMVIVLGNAVALVLEGIIASVQALRLEYYEFFGKFFSGGGQPFTPFRLAAERPAPFG